MVVKRVGTKGDDGCPVFSLRCRGTCQDRGVLEQEGQEGEGEVGGFSFPVLEDGDSSIGGGDGGGGGDGPGKRDSRSQRT